MGKGSKARPLSVTANEFWDNWDRVFEERSPLRSKYRCIQCGYLDESEVHQETSTDYEPYGDRIVARTMTWLTCEHCGNDVEDNEC